ncbi:hypothetical protein ABZ070_29005 [Streptomyces sp. NPDC006283]|uniref:hypothetical protein n=1 Tax=Streptomyces sp. NPDC006283 TaxID=3156741 RepID=UPI0033A9BBBE
MPVVTENLPECAIRYFDGQNTLLHLARRTNRDWMADVLSVVAGAKGIAHAGVEAATMFGTVTIDDLRRSLLPVSESGARDLLKLLAVGSFYWGPEESLHRPDPVRDKCVRDTLQAVGSGADFFTNHGHAEDGYEADFLQAGFHFNSLATTLYDICLIAVSPDFLLVAWRFEDA